MHNVAAAVTANPQQNNGFHMQTAREFSAKYECKYTSSQRRHASIASVGERTLPLWEFNREIYNEHVKTQATSVDCLVGRELSAVLRNVGIAR
jgi:hypothetical protein